MKTLIKSDEDTAKSIPLADNYGERGYKLVEKSEHNGQEAMLLKKVTMHLNTVYAFTINGRWSNYYYNSDAAFNALERWEVSVGKLPKSYDPKRI